MAATATSLRLFALGVLCLNSALASDVRPARAAATPTDAAVQKEMQRIAPQRKSIFEADTDASGKAARKSFPRIDAPVQGGVDVEAIARRYERKASAMRTDGLMAFASLNMPAPSLRRLVADMSKVGGVVVLRGFKDGSLKATSMAISELGVNAGTVQINPQAFVKYKIDAVPALVIFKPEAAEVVDSDGCALPDHYTKVRGDVTLAYALDQVVQRSPAFKEIASRHLRSVGGLR